MEKKTRFFRTALPEDWYKIVEDDKEFSISKCCPDTGNSFATEEVESHDVLREEFRIKYEALVEAIEMASLEGVKHCILVSDLEGELAIRTSVKRIRPLDKVVDIFDSNDYVESAYILHVSIPRSLEERVGKKK